MSQRSLRLRVAVSAVLSVVLAAALGACSSGTSQHAAKPADTAHAAPATAPPATSAGTTPPITGAQPGLGRYYHQKVSWHPCRSGDRCTRITVPLDYAHPSGRAISLAVLDVPAQHPGSSPQFLVVNPGGPGGSGIDYAANAATYFGQPLRDNFDIVGFDPRGVGQSTPVQCLSDHQLDVFLASDPDPDTAAERQHSDQMLTQFGRGCVRDSGALAAHISTEEAARDIDILRAVLGQPKLDYFGASYGTFLGATYAGLFPKRVGRMVLDGAVDPALSTYKLNLVQAHGFEVALRAYIGNCVQQGGCFLGSSVDAGEARIQQLLASVEAHPLPGFDGRQLAIGNAVMGIWAPLYNRSYWPILDAALQNAFAGNGAVLLKLSDAYTSRGANGYTDNSTEALYDIDCLDHDDSIPTSQVPKHFPEFEKASPTFGKIFAFGLSTCSTWPIHTGRVPAPIHAPGAAPILVIGTTRDPATPLVWAQALARELQSGILVTRNGDGHTGYHAGNACVDSTVESYLVAGKVPGHDVRC